MTTQIIHAKTLRGRIAIGGSVSVQGMSSMWKVSEIDRDTSMACLENQKHNGVRMKVSTKMLKKEW